jgi:hypothetical protein
MIDESTIPSATNLTNNIYSLRPGESRTYREATENETIFPNADGSVRYTNKITGEFTDEFPVSITDQDGLPVYKPTMPIEGAGINGTRLMPDGTSIDKNGLIVKSGAQGGSDNNLNNDVINVSIGPKAGIPLVKDNLLSELGSKKDTKEPLVAICNFPAEEMEILRKPAPQAIGTNTLNGFDRQAAT